VSDRAKRFSVHRIRSTDLYADPGRYGFEVCGCGRLRACPECGGLGLVRTVQPCIGCGHCCLASPCSWAANLRGQRSERCAYLFWGSDRYWCGLAGTVDERIARGIEHGSGCCQALNPWRKDVRFRG